MTHSELEDEFQAAFQALKDSGLEYDADDPIAARYREASSAVNHSNRKREAQGMRGAAVQIGRGLRKYLDFKDTYGARIVVSDSSAVTGFGPDGEISGPFAWLRIDGGEISNNDGASHLNVEQARSIRDALDLFIEENSHEGNTAVGE